MFTQDARCARCFDVRVELAVAAIERPRKWRRIRTKVTELHNDGLVTAALIGRRGNGESDVGVK